MKKIVKYLVAAVAMVAAVSCQEELVLNEKPAQNSGKPVFTASINNLNTRTVLEEESMKTLWHGGELINIIDFEGVNSTYAAAALEAPAQKVDFSFYEGADFYGKSVFAVYPHHEVNRFWTENGAFGVVVNHWTTQVAAAGTFDSDGAVHVAYNPDFTANNNLVFSNVSALIKFTVTDPGVKKLKFYGFGGEVVSGPVKYRYDNGQYVVEDATSGEAYVELYAPQGQYLEVGKNYYIAVVPGTFEKGVAIEVNDHLENKIVYKHEGKVVLNSNTINDFGSFATLGDLTWGLVGSTINNWGATADVELVREGDMFVCEGYEFTANTEFKIRATNQWNDDANYGFTFRNVVEENGVYDLTNGGWAQNINVRPGTYDIWFDPFGMKLYMMAPGVDPSEAESYLPARYVVGAFNGWTNPDLSDEDDTKYKMQWDGTFFTSFVEFTEDQADNGKYPFKVNSGDWSFDWGVDQSGFAYYSGESFKTLTNDKGGNNILLDNPGFYMIQQSYDGYDMVVTDVETPKGKQIYIQELGFVFDLGAFEDGMLYMAMLDEDDPTVAWMYEDNMMAYPFELKPTGVDTGEITYNASMTMRPEYLTIAYGIDGSSIKLYCEALGLEGTEAVVLSDEEAVSIQVWTPDLPDAQIDGQQWRGTFDGKEYLIDLGYTYEGKLAFAELGEDNVWHFIYAGDYYYSGDASFATVDYADSDFFLFEMPEEINTGFVYNVYNEALWGEEAVMFVNVTEEVFEPFNTPDGKQFGFNWLAMGMGDLAAVIDFGASVEGLMLVAYDPAVLGAPEGTPYAAYNGMAYGFMPVDDENGSLILIDNYFGTETAVEYTYIDGKLSVDLSNIIGQPLEDVTETEVEIDLSSIVGGGPSTGDDL